MTALLLAVALAVSPPTIAPTRVDRLAGYIVSVSPSAAPYARELASRILYEATAQRLDPALLTAVAYLESRYRLYPHGGGPKTHLAALWQIYPDETWLTIPRADRLRWSRSITVATWRAATILAYHVARCGEHTPACYCRFNRNPCRRGYTVTLFKAAKAIRAVIAP